MPVNPGTDDTTQLAHRLLSRSIDLFSVRPAGSELEIPIPQLPERYEFLDVLGAGGVGLVLRVRDRVLKREVALKVVRTFTASPRARERFLKEAQTTAQLAHPGIIPLYDLGETESGDYFVTMKIVQGQGTLRDAMREHARRPGTRSRNRLLRHLIEIANALGYAHQESVVHRDLKPENVMIGSYGETLLVDWGLAKILGEVERAVEGERPRIESDVTDLTHDGAILGTLRYMSPEQAGGENESVDGTTDLWALGVILYEILAGEPPFDGVELGALLGAIRHRTLADPRTKDRTIPAELAAIAMKCLERRRPDRYASATQLAEDLQAFLESRSVRALSDPWRRRLVKLCRRNPWPSASVAAVVAILAATGLGLRWRAHSERSRAFGEATSRVDAALAHSD
mgnify:CR=1 FL=1